MPLQRTIDEIRDGLEQERFHENEMSVRQGIVEPLLRGLGWPTNDTRVVFPEYSIADGRVDYALCCPPVEPVALIEAKSIGKINEGAEQQLFSYAFHQGVPILVLTDGQQWRFFYPAGRGDYGKRKVCVLNLSDGDSEKNANLLQRYLGYTSIQNSDAFRAIEDDYRLLSSQREAAKHLPETWRGLVEGADEFLLELVAEETESVCGHRPSEELVLDFLKNLGSAPVPREDSLPPPKPRPSARSPIRLTFIVTMPDGERIERDTIRATFVAVIEKLGEQFGMDRLVDLGLERYSTPIIATSKYLQFQQSQSGSHYILANQTTEDKKRDLKFWQIQSGSHYILVNQMTRDKERDLKKIAKGLGIKLEIECRPKETV